MAKVSEAEEYLSVVGRLLPPDCDDRTWLLVIASGFANGLISELSWDSAQGEILMGFIDEVRPDYLAWLEDQEINPLDFPRG